MQAIAKRVEMAMNPKGYHFVYDVYVPVSELDRTFNHLYRIESPNGRDIDCVTYATATLPQWIHDMPRGFERYTATLEHEDSANVIAWDRLHLVFPETRQANLNALPKLWVTYDNQLCHGHSTVWVDMPIYQDFGFYLGD